MSTVRDLVIQGDTPRVDLVLGLQQGESVSGSKAITLETG
jgi:hypothetical protein